MKKIFNPNTVAVFGATNRKESIGYSVMNNIIGAGYEGVIYPVNLKRNSVFGIKAYKNIKEINDTVDLAVIATPFRTIVDIVKQCGENGVGGIVNTKDFNQYKNKGADVMMSATGAMWNPELAQEINN